MMKRGEYWYTMECGKTLNASRSATATHNDFILSLYMKPPGTGWWKYFEHGGGCTTGSVCWKPQAHMHHVGEGHTNSISIRLSLKQKWTSLIWLSHTGGIICGVKHGPPAFRQASDCICLSMWLPQLQDSLLIHIVVLHLVDKKHYCPCPAPLEAPCVTTRHFLEHLHVNFPVSQRN